MVPNKNVFVRELKMNPEKNITIKDILTLERRILCLCVNDRENFNTLKNGYTVVDMDDFYFQLHGFIFCVVEEVYRLGLEQILPEQILSSMEKDDFNIEKVSDIFLEISNNNPSSDIQNFIDNCRNRKTLESKVTDSNVNRIILSQDEKYSLFKFIDNDLYHIGLPEDFNNILYDFPDEIKMDLSSSMEELEVSNYKDKKICPWYQSSESISEYVYYV